VKVRGHRLDVFFTAEGTAHVPSLYAVDSDTDEPASLGLSAPWLDDLWGGDELGLVVYHSTPFLIHYKDATHPVHLKSLVDDASCNFGTTAHESASPRALEPELCDALIAGKGPDSIDLDQPVSITRETVQERYGETEADKRDLIDILNNRAPVDVVHLALSSGAGAGCDEEFFDVLNDAGNGWGSSQSHELISELQHLTTNRYPILPCGNSARLFQYHGQIFFESTWTPLDTWHEQHYVTRVKNGRVEDVCGITFHDRVDVLAQPAAAAPENATDARDGETSQAKLVFGYRSTGIH
jgi:hypothetical protein